MRAQSFHDCRATVALLVAGLVFQIPFLYRGLSFLDEGSILAIADGLRHGERLYADRVIQAAPLTYELLALLLGIFGSHLLVGRLLQALVFSGCVLLVYAILRAVVAPRWALFGALAVLAVKPLGFPLWTIVNYSQLAFLFCLASIWAVLRFLPRRQLPWLGAAGVAVGLTIVTKQNLGAFIGATVATVVVADWLSGSQRRLIPLARGAGVLLVGALLPVAATVGLFAWRGTVEALAQRTVLDLFHLTEHYGVPLPGLSVWADRPETYGEVSFTYFPAPVIHLAWQGRVNLYSRANFIAIEHAVKTLYFLPLLFLAGGLVATGRRLLARTPAEQWSRPVGIVAFALMAYVSMLYRADWTHLMNVYPAFLILAVVVLAPWASGSRWRTWAAVTLWALWMAAGLVGAAVVLAAYRTPVDTPRGRMLVVPADAVAVERVLAYLRQQPADERILFLQGDPLYYFLSGRRVPLPFDQVMPGIVGGPDDDRLIAERLSGIDQVLYNPHQIPSVRGRMPDYAPRTAAILAANFRVTEILSHDTVVLRPAPARRFGAARLDLWSRFEDLRREAGASPAAGALERTSWLMYRVIALRLDPAHPRACFSLAHLVAPNDAVVGLPMSHPDRWVPREADSAAGDLKLAIAVSAGSGPAETIYSRVASSARPGDWIQLRLDAYAGKPVEIQFCASVAEGALQQLPVQVGWAELRIVESAQP